MLVKFSGVKPVTKPRPNSVTITLDYEEARRLLTRVAFPTTVTERGVSVHTGPIGRNGQSLTNELMAAGVRIETYEQSLC